MRKYGDIGHYRVDDRQIDVTTFGSTTKTYLTERGGTATLMAISNDTAVVIKSDMPWWHVGREVSGVMPVIEWED